MFLTTYSMIQRKHLCPKFLNFKLLLHPRSTSTRVAKLINMCSLYFSIFTKEAYNKITNLLWYNNVISPNYVLSLMDVINWAKQVACRSLKTPHVVHLVCVNLCVMRCVLGGQDQPPFAVIPSSAQYVAIGQHIGPIHCITCPCVCANLSIHWSLRLATLAYRCNDVRVLKIDDGNNINCQRPLCLISFGAEWGQRNCVFIYMLRTVNNGIGDS